MSSFWAAEVEKSSRRAEIWGVERAPGKFRASKNLWRISHFKARWTPLFGRAGDRVGQAGAGKRKKIAPYGLSATTIVIPNALPDWRWQATI